MICGRFAPIGALCEFEAYHRDLPAQFRAAANPSAQPARPRMSVLA
jgi:hypothetical protein